MDCRKGTGDHVSWKPSGSQTIKADCLSHQILFAKVGESLSVFRRHYGATASVAPYTLMAHQHLEVVAGQRVCLF